MSKTNRRESWARCHRALSRGLVAGATAGWLLASSAHAEPATEAPAGENRNANLDVARSVAVAGREAFNAGDYETALGQFRRAYTLYPAPTVVLYEARTLEKMGLLLEAAEAYVRTTQTPVPSDAPGQFAEAIAAARQEERALRARIPTLTLRVDGVSANDPNLEVSINGRAIGAAQLGQAQRLNPGTYRIKGSIGGDRSDIAELVLSEGQKASVALSPPAPTVIHPAPTTINDERPASPGDSLRLAAYVSGGVGLVGVGGGIVTGLMAVKKHGEAVSECQDNTCDPGLIKDFHSMRTVSTVFYGVGAAGLAAGIVFWLVAPSASDASQARAIQPWTDARTLGVQGAF